jgi:site-specific DNA-cytosine methylase
MSGTCEKGVAVLELYSGSGAHGHIIATVLKETLIDKEGHRPHISLIRADIKQAAAGNPEINADIMSATSADIRRLKLMYPNKRWIVLASPPCESYSIANTTGDTSKHALEVADEKVLQVQKFIDNLEATLGVLENPATGRLKQRKVRFIFISILFIAECR